MKGTDLLATAKDDLKMTIKFIITGYPSAEVGAKARDYGADAFILKPVKMDELLSIIHTFLGDLEEVPYQADERDDKFTLSEVNSRPITLSKSCRKRLGFKILVMQIYSREEN